MAQGYTLDIFAFELQDLSRQTPRVVVTVAELSVCVATPGVQKISVVDSRNKALFGEL